MASRGQVGGVAIAMAQALVAALAMSRAQGLPTIKAIAIIITAPDTTITPTPMVLLFLVEL